MFNDRYALQLQLPNEILLEINDLTGSFEVDNEKSYNFQIWNTNDGNLLAEWKPSDGDHDHIHYSCIACSFTGKKVVWIFKKTFWSLMLFYTGFLLFLF